MQSVRQLACQSSRDLMFQSAIAKELAFASSSCDVPVGRCLATLLCVLLMRES
jgi:hypothetical protein